MYKGYTEIDKIYQEEVMDDFNKKINPEKPKKKKKKKVAINEMSIQVNQSREQIGGRKELGSTTKRREKIELVNAIITKLNDREAGVQIGPIVANMVKSLNPMFFDIVSQDVYAYLSNPTGEEAEEVIGTDDEESSDELGPDGEMSFGGEPEDIGADDVLGKGLDTDTVGDLVDDSGDNGRGRLMKSLMARKLLRN